jgi:hypothetical protein
MFNTSEPAIAAGGGGLRNAVLLGGLNGYEGNPPRIEFQYEARRYLSEAKALVGADAFAAQALAFHFGRLAGGDHV